ncbi:hypothetical protein [Pseudarthrobacter sp. MM222]|uniref:hypothetical protein n=1 Tax=Pseudarthrobacter sp. MM222 TaxID=3018929 RepID=UPI00221FBD1D|nr:hypothetical protein [Pseudarthrobacter sp. MM222]CAI3793513.1 hypothetical protein NKCBBBOE_00825 [Pseudarthrobacter sp. MM222]
MGRKAEHPVRNALILSGVLLSATVAVILVGPQDHVSQEVVALLAGLAVGAWLLRFSPPWRWLAMLVLVLSLVLCLVLGPVGIAWFGGFIAGTQAGLAWQHASKRRKPAKQTRETAEKAEWLVDGRGLSTVAEAREAAGVALHDLDGKSRGRLAVQYRSARFEVAGGVGLGMVCHRNADATNEGSWAVLVRSAGVADESVEVPMGDVKGFMPSRLVHDVDSIEAALADFFRNPEASSFGPEWVTGSEAEATRLTTH